MPNRRGHFALPLRCVPFAGSAKLSRARPQCTRLFGCPKKSDPAHLAASRVSLGRGYLNVLLSAHRANLVSNFLEKIQPDRKKSPAREVNPRRFQASEEGIGISPAELKSQVEAEGRIRGARGGLGGARDKHLPKKKHPDSPCDGPGFPGKGILFLCTGEWAEGGVCVRYISSRRFFSACGKLPRAQRARDTGAPRRVGWERASAPCEGCRVEVLLPRSPRSAPAATAQRIAESPWAPPKKVTRLTLRRAGSPWEGDIWMHSVSGPEALWVADFF